MNDQPTDIDTEEYARRNAFLLNMADTLRSLDNPAAIQRKAIRLLRKQLSAERAFYVNFETEAEITLTQDHDDLASHHDHVTGKDMEDFSHALDAWLPDLRAGKTLVLADMRDGLEMSEAAQQRFVSLRLRACVATPLLKDGHLIGCLAVTLSSPHAWSAFEIALVEEAGKCMGTALERTVSEVALQVSEAQLQAALLAGGMATWRWDTAMDRIVASNTLTDVFGLQVGQHLKTNSQRFDSIHPDDVAQYRALVEAARREGGRWHTEFRMIRPRDGQLAWLEERGHAKKDSRTGRMYLDGLVWDVTERKRVEEQLRQSEEQFRLLVEGARDYAMFMLDPNSRITLWSAGAARVFGWAAKEVQGRSGAIIFTPEDRAQGRVETERQIALDHGRAEDRRWHLRKDGTRLFLDGVLIRLDDAEGRLRGFVKVGRDATAQHEAEEAVKRSQEELEMRVEARTAELSESQNQLRQMAARMEHLREEERIRIAREIHDELGASLTALKMQLAGVMKRYRDEVEITSVLNDIFNQMDGLVHTVQHIASELRPPILDFIGLIPALEWQVHEWEQRTGIPCWLDILQEINVEMGEPTRTAVFRAFQEALTNVTRHAQATLVTVTVDVQAEYLVLTVQDDGRGMDTRLLEQRRSLGLMGMQERVQEVAGDMRIESEPGHGTTVMLHVPLVVPPTGN